MTVRELIQELLLNANLDDNVEIEVKTDFNYAWSNGNANDVIATKDGSIVITSDNQMGV